MIAAATTELAWLPSGWSIVISAILLIMTTAICYTAWHRSGFKKSVGLLELLRLMIVGFIALLLNQPEWQTEYRPDTKPTIAVLWDNSPSMQTRDVLPFDASTGNTGSAKARTRSESIDDLIQPETWQKLGDDLRVIIQPINSFSNSDALELPDASSGQNSGVPADSQGTNLNEPLQQVGNQLDDLLGVVMVSDGDWNEGDAPVQAATRLQMKNVPIFSVPVGSSQQLPDIEVVTLDLPTFATLGKQVRVPYSLSSSLPRVTTTTVTLTTSAGETLNRQVEVAAMGKTSDAFVWKPEQKGDFIVSISVPAHSDEIILTNNQMSAPIAIREERLRVLIVESLPRWEYRYLRNALSRDPGIDVSCLLFHPKLKMMGGGSTDYIQAFPETIEELAQFDVVFLGDVGLADNQLTVEQAKLLKGLVQFQASGLVFMPGWQGRQAELLETELDELYPVELDLLQPEGWGAQEVGRFQLSETGRLSLLTKLADTSEENTEVWENLPGFQWYAPVVRSRPGSETLAVHGDVANQYGRLPLLVTRTFGSGKVLFMGTDGAWRWRKGVEDKYHYRFWGQVIRWMAYQRNMARGESMRFYYSPDQPSRRQSMSLTAHVTSRSGEPLQQGTVVAQITSPSGQASSVRLIAEGDQWGVFRARFTPEEPGRYEVLVSSAEAANDLETNFFVQGSVTEPLGKPARPEVLEELAALTGGVSVRPDQVDQIVSHLASLPMPPPSIRRIQLWCHPLVVAILIGLLALFWIGRKSYGFI